MVIKPYWIFQLKPYKNKSTIYNYNEKMLDYMTIKFYLFSDLIMKIKHFSMFI